MKSVHKRQETKNETPDKNTIATVRAIAREHGMSYRDAVVQYRKMEAHY